MSKGYVILDLYSQFEINMDLVKRGAEMIAIFKIEQRIQNIEFFRLFFINLHIENHFFF